jgi:hypothetical protein
MKYFKFQINDFLKQELYYYYYYYKKITSLKGETVLFAINI